MFYKLFTTFVTLDFISLVFSVSFTHEGVSIISKKRYVLPFLVFVFVCVCVCVFFTIKILKRKINYTSIK